MSLSVVGFIVSKYTASLLPNNLSYIDGCNGFAFVHRNQAVIMTTGNITESALDPGASTDETTSVPIPCSTIVVPYDEEDVIAQVKWVKLSFGPVLVLVTCTGRVHIYDSTGIKLLHVCRIERDSEKVAEAARGITSNCSDRVFIGTRQGSVIVLHVLANQLTRMRPLTSGSNTSHRHPISDLATDCIKDTSILVSADMNGFITIWDLGTLMPISVLGPYYSPCTSIAVTADTIGAGFLSGHVRIFTKRYDYGSY